MSGDPTFKERIARLSAMDDAARVIESLRIALRALEFYANESSWEPDDWGCRSVVQPPDYANGGQKARNAIKRIQRKLAAKEPPPTPDETARGEQALAHQLNGGGS